MTIRTSPSDHEILQKVKSYILETILIGAFEENLESHDSFLQKGILDSTGVLELVQFLEEQYNFKCHDNEITPENLDSLNAVANYVRRKLANISTSA